MSTCQTVELTTPPTPADKAREQVDAERARCKEIVRDVLYRLRDAAYGATEAIEDPEAVGKMLDKATREIWCAIDGLPPEPTPLPKLKATAPRDSERVPMTKAHVRPATRRAAAKKARAGRGRR